METASLEAIRWYCSSSWQSWTSCYHACPPPPRPLPGQGRTGLLHWRPLSSPPPLGLWQPPPKPTHDEENFESTLEESTNQGWSGRLVLSFLLSTSLSFLVRSLRHFLTDRGGHHVGDIIEKLSIADISAFFQIICKLWIWGKYIWELSKNYQYQKKCIQLHIINSIERTDPKKERECFFNMKLSLKTVAKLCRNTRQTSRIVKDVHSFNSDSCILRLFVAKLDLGGIYQKSYRKSIYWPFSNYRSNY